jgi:signal transduction histidine kinase
MLRSRDGSVWVASNSGLYRFYQNAWVENGMEDGLPGAAVREIYEDERGVWAGTTHGLSLYHADADPDPPQTRLQEFNEAEKSIPEGGSITVTFSGQDKWKFTPRSRLVYSGRLDERDWSPFQEVNGITLSDQPAGKHVFQVRAMDRNCRLEPDPARLEFVVIVPWYKESRLLLISFAGGAVALFFAGLAVNRHRRLVRSYAEVEQKVADRTRELEIANRELMHSQKMTALGTLAAGIAHDFNNILSIIKGSAQIIEDNLDNPAKVTTRVERIKTVVEQGAGIVKAMLGFSRDSDSQIAPCDLNEVARDTIKLLGDRFLREVQVTFEPTPNLPSAPGSKDFIQQILLNFIFNAAEAMAKRRQVILATQRLDSLPNGMVLAPAQAGEYVVISVRDFGCGITPENMPRIFEPFFTTKALSVRRGTGLGLSMVYELAKKMEAGLAVESVVDQGSAFTLILAVREIVV